MIARQKLLRKHSSGRHASPGKVAGCVSAKLPVRMTTMRIVMMTVSSTNSRLEPTGPRRETQTTTASLIFANKIRMVAEYPMVLRFLSIKPIRRLRTMMGEASWKRALLSREWDATERIRRAGGDLFYSSVLVFEELDVVASGDACLLSWRRAE